MLKKLLSPSVEWTIAFFFFFLEPLYCSKSIFVHIPQSLLCIKSDALEKSSKKSVALRFFAHTPLMIWNILNAHYQSCLFLSFSSLLLAASIHWFAQSCCESTNAPQQCLDYFFYTGFGWPKFAYVANPVPPGTRHMTYKLHFQQRSCFRFSILSVLYMQDTFALVLNFMVGHFARHFLFLSSGVAMKGIKFTQLHCHIWFLCFIQFTTCFLSSRGRLLDS